MADRGIIFSAPMVRALLDGRKTQTRRLLANAPEGEGWHCDPTDTPSGYRFVAEGGTPSLPCTVPHAVGDRLYVREAWRTWKDYDHLPPSEMLGDEPAFFEADRDNCDRHGRLRPGMHMPRWASRLTLIVTEVRVQRLQAITEEDARAEGAQQREVRADGSWTHGHSGDWNFMTARRSFEDLWGSLHDKPGTTWADNPWIYAVTFDVRHGNIDEVAA